MVAEVAAFGYVEVVRPFIGGFAVDGECEQIVGVGAPVAVAVDDGRGDDESIGSVGEQWEIAAVGEARRYVLLYFDGVGLAGRVDGFAAHFLSVGIPADGFNGAGLPFDAGPCATARGGVGHHDAFALAVEQQFDLRAVAPRVDVLHARVVPMALQSHAGTLLEGHPQRILVDAVFQFGETVGVHGAGAEALLVAHAVEVDGVAFTVGLGEHPVDPSAGAVVDVVEVVLHIVLRESFFIVVVEAGDAPAGVAAPIGAVDLGVERGIVGVLLVAVGVADDDRVGGVPMLGISVAVEHQAGRYEVPFVHFLLGVGGPIAVAVPGQSVVRLPHGHAGVVAVGYDEVAVVFSFVGERGLVLERPLVVAGVDDEQHAVFVGGAERVEQRSLVAYAQGVAAAGCYACHVLPLESFGEGGAQPGVEVAVAEAAEYAQFAVDVAVVFVPCDGAQAHAFAAGVGSLAVGFHFEDHVVEIGGARQPYGIP